MKKWDKQINQATIDNEKEVLEALKKNYEDALEEINTKIVILLGRQDADMQHVIYQVEYQKALKTQIEGILDMLQANEFETISEYLTKCYDEGFQGALYSMQAQGVPFAFPIDQEQVVKAIQHDTMLSESLYESLGKDIEVLNKQIASEISRGISTGAMYSDIARNINGYAGIGRNNAMRIARTEGHRIQSQANYDAQVKAKSKGADIVKIWSAALDAKTRDSHFKLDGQQKEIDEPFVYGKNKAMFPGEFGVAHLDINCRCRAITKARWLLDADQTKMLGDVSKMSDKQKNDIAKKLGMKPEDLAQYSGQIIPVRAKDYADFKRQYDKLWHYEGSDLQKEAEERIAGYKKKKEEEKKERVRLSTQKTKMAFEDDSIQWDSKGEKITKEQYKEIMQYARNNNIELSGFKHYDGDIKNIKDLIDDAHSVANLYPKLVSGKQKLTIALSSTMDSRDFAITNGHIISINADAYRNIEQLAKEYQKLVDDKWFVQGTDYHAIIKHEIGHVVGNVYNIDAMKIAKELIGTEYNAVVADYVFENLSQYSAKYNDGREILSECFASVYNSSIKNEFALKIVEKCGNIISQ